MSPRNHDAEPFRSYYDRPIVKEPTWAPVDIAGYFFSGGLAGISSVVAAGAHATGRRHMARSSKITALAAISASLLALVHDLGRPARFLNMLRVFKPTSPMSVGVWLLSAYAPAAGVAAATDVTGRMKRTNAAATGGAALLGPMVASYTAVLIADTAIPAWHETRRELPFVFVSSAANAAAGLALVAAPSDEVAPARRLAATAAVAELAMTRRMEDNAGIVGGTYREGRAGKLMNAAKLLTAAGALAGLVPGSRIRRVGGAALLAGSAVTRFGVFEAGRASARDPRYVVVPQRERANAGSQAAS